MGALREYVLSLVAASMICSIVLQLLPDSGRKELLRTISGAALAIVILQPLSQIRSEELMNSLYFDMPAADPYLSRGEKTAAEMKRQYITKACEAYILEEAKKMGAVINTRITLDSACQPVYVEIQGLDDPEIRKKLEYLLTEDMGITKENQLWTGIQGSSG